MSNVDSGDVNDIPEEAFARAQQYYASAVARWLGDVVYEELATDPGLARDFQATLRELADRMDAGKLRVPEALR